MQLTCHEGLARKIKNKAKGPAKNSHKSYKQVLEKRGKKTIRTADLA
jgi:hypothetical protein